MMHPVTRLSLRSIKEQGASLIMIPGEIPVATVRKQIRNAYFLQDL
jgi:hypothetical protein